MIYVSCRYMKLQLCHTPTSPFSQLSWLTSPMTSCWLVAEPTPLKNMSSSVGMMIIPKYQWEHIV